MQISNDFWPVVRGTRLAGPGAVCTLSVLIAAGNIMGCGPGPAGRATDNRAVERPTPLVATEADRDADGLDDALEDALAEKFAPIVYHGELETSFPVNVDWWLARTHLSSTSADAASPRSQRLVFGPLRQDQLIDVRVQRAGRAPPISSSGTRSRVKVESFFLEDVAAEFRSGQLDPAAWTTYVHSYPNMSGGITLQYWRAYVWNDARFGGLDLGHGGDWEGIAVHLNASSLPQSLSYLQHSGIVEETSRVQWEGTHPMVFSEEGRHSSRADRDALRSKRLIRQETWPTGHTTWFTGALSRTSGGLINVGEKSHPRNQQLFVQYSGLWGAKGRLFVTSGYWGPAFNETGAECANGSPAYGLSLRYRAARASCGRIFLKAWCDGLAEGTLDQLRECFASSDTR